VASAVPRRVHDSVAADRDACPSPDGRSRRGSSTPNSRERSQSVCHPSDKKLGLLVDTAINVTPTERLKSDDSGSTITVVTDSVTKPPVSETEPGFSSDSRTDEPTAEPLVTIYDTGGDTDIWSPCKSAFVELRTGSKAGPPRVAVVAGSGVAAFAFPNGDDSC